MAFPGVGDVGVNRWHQRLDEVSRWLGVSALYGLVSLLTWFVKGGSGLTPAGGRGGGAPHTKYGERHLIVRRSGVGETVLRAGAAPGGATAFPGSG